MKHLLTYFEQKNQTASARSRVLRLVSVMLSALIGFLVWLVIRPFALSTTDWMLCFIGYPAVITWFAALFYSWKHQ